MDESLGTKIDIHLAGKIEHWSGTTLNANDIGKWGDYLKQNGSIPIKKATHVLFTNENG